MTTFGLVHGAWHGGWCWAPVVPLLRAAGHRAVCVDLPAGDPAAGCAAYADVVVGALADAGDDVVLVGHSLGGLTIPVVAARRPVRALLFVAALLPVPGRSVDEQSADEPDMLVRGLGAGQVRYPDGSTSWRVGPAVERMYPDAPRDAALAAARRLRRQYWRPTAEVTPLAGWPDVPAVSVVCAGDRVVNPAWGRRAARDRLGVDAVELPGDHSPFLARPAALAALLLAAARAAG